ncbi:NUDIX domain-containing protein [Actinomadura sp. NAK00032]|uniref:NUDIX hydrolase n=1 Tax=Actinomadura sp. NAK00032 TaxID=2742128 RepID=UPI0020C7B6A4|nr:NUDIX domain-containing protein [Actinomadura sp. NAK00032]
MFSSQEQSDEVSVAVDLVIFTVRDGALQVLLIERGKEPFLGGLALPGGYVRGAEGLDAAAARELFEETGVDPARLHLEQLRTYGEPERDPRGRVFSVAYLALGPDLPSPVAGTDAATAFWMPVKKAQSAKLAFDHAVILSDGLERARAKLEYSTVATAFCQEPFTVADLRRVYEVVWDAKLEPSNFHRKVTRAEGFLVPAGRHRAADLGRPAALYRRGGATTLTPPLLR